ncbi:MAG: c-type cytochrome, partial [Acidobacteria bacterium]|nr:c-type cytochrome [Acidobacteriota bacterium]
MCDEERSALQRRGCVAGLSRSSTGGAHVFPHPPITAPTNRGDHVAHPACLPLSLARRGASQAQEVGDQDPIAALGAADLERGQFLFQAHCARCHGYDGRGGEGPSLARPSLRNAADSVALFGVIQNGIPERGMPGAWQISDREIWQVAGYVRSLGQSAVEVSGDAQ